MTRGSAAVVEVASQSLPSLENVRRSMNESKKIKMSKLSLERIQSDRLVSFGSGISIAATSCTGKPMRCLWCFEIRDEDQLFPGRLLTHCQNCGQVGTTQREEKELRHIYVEEYFAIEEEQEKRRVVRIPRQRNTNSADISNSVAS